jgi:hypothetical protein
VLAAAAISSSSAYAAEEFKEPCEKHEGTKSALCIENKELVKGEVPFKVETDTFSTLTVEKGPTIVCKEVGGKGEIVSTADQITAINTILEFKGECKVINSKETEEACKVVEPIKVEAAGESPKYGLIDFKPKTGTAFTEITIRSISPKTCTFAGEKQKVKGKQSCSIAKPDELEVKKLIECTPAGSELKYGASENKATFQTSVWVALAAPNEGKKWNILELGN